MYLYLGIVIFGLMYYLGMRKYYKLAAKYKHDPNVDVLKPYPLVGRYPKFLTGSIPVHDMAVTMYNDVKHKSLCITHLMGDAILSVNDPAFVKEVAVKGFNHFVDRIDMKALVDVRKAIIT